MKKSIIVFFLLLLSITASSQQPKPKIWVDKQFNSEYIDRTFTITNVNFEPSE